MTQGIITHTFFAPFFCSFVLLNRYSPASLERARVAGITIIRTEYSQEFHQKENCGYVFHLLSSDISKTFSYLRSFIKQKFAQLGVLFNYVFGASLVAFLVVHGPKASQIGMLDVSRDLAEIKRCIFWF